MRTWSGGARVRLGQYEPLLELASGGMATVYLARQSGAAGFERLVVIKRVHKNLLKDRESYEMLVDEARVASLIRHPNVVPVIDVAEADGEIFLVLEYVESIPLAALLGAARADGAPLPAAITGRILSDVLSGLHAAHEAVDMKGDRLNVVHRDVSPQNVIIGVDGVSRLIDFGIAQATRRLSSTSAGVMKGKFGYMAPEQAKQLPLDHRVDVFAAGIVAFEALTGRRLFTGDDEGDILLATLLAEVPDPSSIVPGLDPTLDFVVQTALARDREERFQTAKAFLVALETALPPAPTREVAELVAHHGGKALATRRAALREALERPAESARPGEPREAPAGSRRALPATLVEPPPGIGPERTVAEAAPTVVVPAPAVQLPAPPTEATTVSGVQAPASRPPPVSSRARIAALFAGSLAAGVAITIALARGGDAPAPEAAPAATPAAASGSAVGARPISPTASAPPAAAPVTVEPGPAATAAPEASSTAAPARPAAPARHPRPASSDLQANPYR